MFDGKYKGLLTGNVQKFGGLEISNTLGGK